MAPSPIPAPLPPWARVLLQVLPLVPIFLQEALEFIGEFSDASSATPDEWRKAQLVWDSTSANIPAERFVTTIDIANITNGAIDSTWTDADYTTVNTHLSTLMTSWAANTVPAVRAREIRYYRMSFNPMTIVDPYPPSGPPERVFPVAAVGTGSGFQAHQVAMTSTERTAYPRHWGRSYWPVPAANLVDAQGYFTNAVVDAWGQELQNRYDALQVAEFFPVVPVTSALGVATRGLLTVDQIQVDNVPDVIRRRRLSVTTRRFVGPA